jgi:alpha-glucosidase
LLCLSVTLQETRENPGKLRVIFRVFNDPIAFRYEWPEQAALKDFDIMDELTEFVYPADHTALWEPV